MEERYVTIAGFNNYYGAEPFVPGRLICCKKEPHNAYDAEAIRCSLPMTGTVGYLANSPRTLAQGTLSAGRLYDKVDRCFYVRVMFITQTKVICRVEETTCSLKREMENQLRQWEEEDSCFGGCCPKL